MKDPVRGYVTLVLLVVVVSLPSGGCAAPRPEKDVRNPDPLGKIPAFKEAVREKDRSAAVQMVKDLDNDDPAIRMFAIIGLRRLTGQTFGYRYFVDEHERRPAIRRWQAWLEEPDPEQQDPQDAVVKELGAAEAPHPASGP